MKRLLVFMLLAVLIISCSSKKILSVRKIAHNGVINNIASRYDFSQKQYSTLNISKNSSAKNLSEVEASITAVTNNQDFLASKDKIGPSVLTTKYSHKELPHFIQQEKINKSLLGEVPILKHKEITKKKSKTKNKILLILVLIILGLSSILMGLISVWGIYVGITGLSSLPILSTILLLMSISGLILSISVLKVFPKLLKKAGRGKSKRGLY